MSAQSRNQIPCTAERLSQLRPEMIQAVVPGSAFAFGHQYFSERRVRIVQADEAKITSEVLGARGLFHQTIRLTDGTLMAKCSCPSSEEPLCRHCVAVLLEYIRLSPDPVQGSSQEMAAQDGVQGWPGMETETAPNQEGPPSGRTAAPSALGVRLREITIFLEWLRAAVNALKTSGALPGTPALEFRETLEWVQILQNFEERMRQGEETIVAIRRELSTKEEHLLRLAHDLEAANGQVKEFQAACEELKLDVDRQRAAVSRLVEIEQERDRLAALLKDVTSDVVEIVGDFDRLTAKWEYVSGENKGSRPLKI
ncbi:MAG TPA: SWIM zinc finger family protein [Nitrospiraceae bacterium]|nr:SWIM zinc finger family protein [Nitrospiraceae bacterium]